jgi:hypothetical protein
MKLQTIIDQHNGKKLSHVLFEDNRILLLWGIHVITGEKLQVYGLYISLLEFEIISGTIFVDVPGFTVVLMRRRPFVQIRRRNYKEII